MGKDKHFHKDDWETDEEYDLEFSKKDTKNSERSLAKQRAKEKKEHIRRVKNRDDRYHPTT